MDATRRLQMAKAGFVDVPKIEPYRKSVITKPTTENAQTPEIQTINSSIASSKKTQRRSGYQYDMKLSSDLTIPSNLHPASLLCTICEVCLRILHFGDVSNDKILEEIVTFGALIGEKSAQYVYSLKEAFYRCPRYSKQMYFVHSLYSIVPQNDRESLHNVLTKLARASAQKPCVAVFTRVVLTDRNGLNVGPDFRDSNDEEEEISGKNALVVGLHSGAGGGGGGVMFYLNTKLEFFDSDTADYFTFSQQNDHKNSAVVFKWMENSIVRMQEYLEKMFAKRNDEMTQLYKLKMRKRGLVREDEGQRKKEILWVVNVISLRNEAMYVPHNVANELLVYESSVPQSVATGLPDGFFVHQEGNQMSTDASHLQQVTEELNTKVLDLEGELELQKQEYELKIHELQEQLLKLETVLLHEQTCDEELGDDEERVRMKGFLQDKQVTREKEWDLKELAGFREKADRQMADYGAEMEAEEKRKREMKNAFLFAKERQRDRAFAEKTQLQKSYQKAITKNWGESSLENFPTIAPKSSPTKPTQQAKNILAPDLCVVCNTHKPISKIRSLTNCSHSLCIDCFREYVATWMKVPFPIQCPIGKKQIQNVRCSVPVSFRDISTLIDQKTRQCPKCRMWIVQKKQQEYGSNSDLLICECGASVCFVCGTAEWPCSTCMNRLL